MTTPVKVNGRLSSDKIFFINNYTTPALLDGLSVHVEPTYFSNNIFGFDETVNGDMWILEPKQNGDPKVYIKIDDSVDNIFGLSKLLPGNKVTNPIVYKRHNLAGHQTIVAKDDDGNPIDIQPLGFAHDIPGTTDWLTALGFHNLDEHLLEFGDSAYDDYIKFEVIINADEVTESQLFSDITSYLSSQFMLTIRPTIFNKPITSIYELMFKDTFSMYTDQDNYNIRF